MTYDGDELTDRELWGHLIAAGLMYVVIFGLPAGGLYGLYLLLEWIAT